MASDGNGVFVTTGNGYYGTMGANLDSEAVVRIRGMASLTRGNADLFFPAEWKAIEDGDDDMGATSPVVFDLLGPTRPLIAARHRRFARESGALRVRFPMAKHDLIHLETFEGNAPSMTPKQLLEFI